MSDVEEFIYTGLPSVKADNFETLWDIKADNRKFNRSMRTPMDADMFQAIQDLAMNKSLPFDGKAAEMGRHIWAAGVESLREYLSADTRTLWSVLQTTQRRLTVERYVVTAEEQVKEAMELLGEWTARKEWSAVRDDLLFALSQIADFPSATWRRRVAHEWATNPTLYLLLQIWQEDMRHEAPEVWTEVRRVMDRMAEIAEV